MASFIGLGRPRAGHRRLAAASRLMLSAIVAATTIFGAAGTVAAASQSKDLVQSFSGGAATNLSMEGFAPCDECVPDWLFPNTPGAIALGVSVKAEITHVDYSSDATTSVGYNDSERWRRRTAISPSAGSATPSPSGGRQARRSARRATD